MPNFNSPDFSAAYAALQRSALPFSPAEAHGIAVGLFSGGAAQPESLWQATLYAELEPGDVLAQECRCFLDEIYRLAQAQMTAIDLALQLFLPAEQEVEYSTSMALRDWAQGFLFGFGLAGIFMLLGMLQFYFAQPLFGNLGDKPVKATVEEKTTTNDALNSEIKLNHFSILDYLLIGVFIVSAIIFIINDPLSKIGDIQTFNFTIAG